MKTQTTKNGENKMAKQPTSALKKSVNSYLLARANAELQRKKVDRIQK